MFEVMMERAPPGTTAWKLYWNDMEKNEELYDWFKYNKEAYGY